MIEEPVTFNFFVSCPETWERKKFERAKNHFRDFELNSVYKSHSSEEYIACENRIKKIFAVGGKTAAIEFLEESIEDKLCIRKNTWQAAMYQALIDSAWYWDKYILTKV